MTSSAFIFYLIDTDPRFRVAGYSLNPLFSAYVIAVPPAFRACIARAVAARG